MRGCIVKRGAKSWAVVLPRPRSADGQGAAQVVFVPNEAGRRTRTGPALGDYPLTTLSPQAIRDYITTKLATGLSPKTVAYHRAIRREALQQAVEDGLLARNAATLVKAPSKRRRPTQVIDEDEEQVRVFLAEAKRFSPHYLLYLAAITTGMWQGELLGLHRQDVDLTLGVASIQQTFYRLGVNKRTGSVRRCCSRRRRRKSRVGRSLCPPW